MEAEPELFCPTFTRGKMLSVSGDVPSCHSVLIIIIIIIIIIQIIIIIIQIIIIQIIIFYVP